MEEDKRLFTRVPFVIRVTLTQNQQLWLGHVVDISFNGMLVNSRTPFTFDAKTPVIAEITFENGSVFKVKTEQAHHRNELYGFRFLEMDLDSMTHLRNLMLLNLGDVDQCERELETLFGTHQAS